MRNRSENEAISVRAISGTRVVLLGLDIKGIGLPEMMARMSLKGPTRPGSYKKPKSMFIGFSITRVDLETDESVSLNEGGKPIQKLLWGDYDVEPGRNYKVSRLCQLRASMRISVPHVTLHFTVRDSSNDQRKGIHVNA